jgi:hypothetical protein
MTKTKEDIIIRVYKSQQVESYCRAIHKEYDELKSQLIYQLIKMPEQKLITAVTKNYLEYMCFVICKRIVAGRVKDSGMFYLAKNHLSIQEGWGLDKIDDDIEDDSSKKIDLVNDIVNKLHWYNKILFNYHYVDGYKLREISLMTGINIKSVAYTIKKTRDEIKKQINK